MKRKRATDPDTENLRGPAAGRDLVWVVRYSLGNWVKISTSLPIAELADALDLSLERQRASAA